MEPKLIVKKITGRYCASINGRDPKSYANTELDAVRGLAICLYKNGESTKRVLAKTKNFIRANVKAPKKVA
jgi:hypothetical protein